MCVCVCVPMCWHQIVLLLPNWAAFGYAAQTSWSVLWFTFDVSSDQGHSDNFQQSIVLFEGACSQFLGFQLIRLPVAGLRIQEKKSASSPPSLCGKSKGPFITIIYSSTKAKRRHWKPRGCSLRSQSQSKICTFSKPTLEPFHPVFHAFFIWPWVKIPYRQ